VTTFWVLAVVMVAAALGLLFVRKAVHCALLLAVVMVSLAVLYLKLEAPFLFSVQIIVYTGAILMLFLFVLMLVGVDSSDSLVETIKGQRVFAAIVGLLFGGTMVAGIAQVSVGTVSSGLSAANKDGNVQGLAQILFSKYVLAFEATSLLLITAAVGAMVLAHRERLTAKIGQAEMARQRMRDYAESGKPLGPLPAPGVFARHNATDTPALLPDGSVAEASISRVLKARGTVQSAPALADDIVELTHDQVGHDGPEGALALGASAAAAVPAAVDSAATTPEVSAPVATKAPAKKATAKKAATKQAAVKKVAPAKAAPAKAVAEKAPAKKAAPAKAAPAKAVAEKAPAKKAAPAKAAPAKKAPAKKAPAKKVEAATPGKWSGSVMPLIGGGRPAGYDIKGNENSMLFHRPGGRWYDITIAEVWFDTAEAAEAAGFTEAGKRKKGGAAK